MSASATLGQILRSAWLHMGFAFVAMGAWAAFANRAHGSEAMALAFLVQGSVSAAITWMLKRNLETSFARFSGLKARIIPPLISCMVIAALLAGVHTLAGTPQIWTTIAVPWTVSTVYGFAYVQSLPKKAPA